MSLADANQARPAPPVVRPRPPLRPVSFFLGAAGALALLVGQYYIERLLVPWLAASTTLGRPWFSLGGIDFAPLLVLEVVGNVALFAAAAVAFYRWTLRQIDVRYHAPVFITCILAGVHFYYGVLENLSAPWLTTLTGGRITEYSPTFVTIAAAIGTELILGRIAYGKWINPASAYVSGISAGILVKSNDLWPYVLCAMISIASKYALRVKDRHLWNPTNFGVTALLLLSRNPASLSVQYGNVVWAPILIWSLGALILSKIGKLHIPLTFAAVYLLISPIRSWITGLPWLTEVAPITSPMYQLFMCFMITDPKTITRKVWSQCLVAGLVAVAEGAFRVAPNLFPAAPPFLSFDAAYFALFIVGPTANGIEMWFTRRPAPAAAVVKVQREPGRAAGFMPAVGSNPPG